MKRLNDWVKKALRWLLSKIGEYWGLILACLVVAFLIWAVVAVVLDLAFGMEWADWTGFRNYTDTRRNLWDLLDLLIIPIVLALGALWFNKTEKENDQKIATDRQRETALQSYIDKMTELLLNKDTPLLKSTTEKDEVRIVARTRTLTTLRTLDPERKGLLLQFLREAELIEKEHVKVDLSRADLVGAILRGAILVAADLRGADLRGADLRGANLSGAILSGATLSGTILSGADLSRTTLSWGIVVAADLRGADLRWANLSVADLSGAILSGADLRGAIVTKEQWCLASQLDDTTMPDGQKYDPATHGPTGVK